MSLRSSSTLTAKTVLEKERAKPSSSASFQSSERASSSPSPLQTSSTTVKSRVESSRCRLVVPHTSRRIRVLILSLRPMVNSSRVTPRSAHLAQGGGIFISHAVEDKTGGQKAEQGRQANQIDYHAATKSHGDQNGFHNRSCKGRRDLPCLTLGW